MVVSSKKKRGKQRKAARSNTPLPDNGNLTPGTRAVLTDVLNRFAQGQVLTPQEKSLIKAKFVGDISRAQNNATESLISEKNNPLDLSYEDSGILTTVLNFLKRCEDETFNRVIRSVKGDLVSPSVWIKVLVRVDASEPSSGLEIAKNIGPLVRCMCNDTERFFFKSNKYWGNCMLVFAELIYKMILRRNNVRNEKVEQLLQYEGLLESIVQWGYWKKEYRPDIIKVLGSPICGTIVDMGMSIVGVLLDDVSKKDKTLLESIGITPTVSRDYDSTYMVPFVIVLIRDVKMNKEKWARVFLQPLIEAGDCIDKDVISEMIDWGMNHVHDCDSAVLVTRLSSFMLCQGYDDEGDGMESDTRIAFAIRCGLVEMCLNFVDRFGGHESFCDEDKALYNHIESIFCNINDASLHQKTAKAIRSKRIVTEDKLVRLVDTIKANDITAKDMSTSIIYNDKCKDLLDMARSILNINGSYCCRCNKSLSKTEVLQCNGCGRMSYCSRACQKDDWLHGHKLTCSKTYNDISAGQFQGRIQPEEVPDDERASGKLKELEVNSTMVHLKLFLDHSETILSKAKGVDIPLYDCVAVFKLYCCPLTIEVKKYTDWFETSAEQRGFEETRSKENITCAYLSFVFNGALDEDDETPVLIMQRFFTHKWLMKQTEAESESVASIE